MAPAEEEPLRRQLGSPGVGIARMMGLLTSLGALALGITYFLGTPYDPNVFPTEILVVGILAIACGAAASGAVRDPKAALRRSEVIDVAGPVSGHPAEMLGMVGVQIGPLELFLPKKEAGRLGVGETRRVVVATGLPAAAKRGAGGIMPDRGLLLSIDGAPLPKALGVSYIYGGTSAAVPSTTRLSLAAAAPTPFGSSETTFCDQCGHRNAAGYKFCARCGAARRAGP
jgi:hypothetical protein